MLNEEKILEMLGEMKSDISALKTEMQELKKNRAVLPHSQMSESEIVERMSNLLTPDEAEAFGRFMDAEEARKATL